MHPADKWKAYRPIKGDEVIYKGKPTGTVRSVEGGLCYVAHYDSDECMPFIWCFHAGLNTMHDWPTKQGRVKLAA